MEISWLGHSCIRLRAREATLIMDPFDKASGYPLTRPTADIVTISHDHPAHSNIAAVAGTPRVVRGPGEFELSGVFITGVRTYHDAKKGEERGPNIAYVVEMEDLRLCHLGDLGHVPTAAQVEEMAGVDVLFVPVGGHVTLDASKASETVGLLEPSLVIPIHYQTEVGGRDLDPVDRFVKEIGAEVEEPLQKLAVTRTSLPSETQLVLLDFRK